MLVIETERLVLRELTEADFEAAREILGDARVMYAWEHGFSDAEDARVDCGKHCEVPARRLQLPRGGRARGRRAGGVHRPAGRNCGRRAPHGRRLHTRQKLLGARLRDGGRGGLRRLCVRPTRCGRGHSRDTAGKQRLAARSGTPRHDGAREFCKNLQRQGDAAPYLHRDEGRTAGAEAGSSAADDGLRPKGLILWTDADSQDLS